MGWASEIFVCRLNVIPITTSADSHSCTRNHASFSLVLLLISAERPAMNVMESEPRLLQFSSDSSRSRNLLEIAVYDERIIFWPTRVARFFHNSVSSTLVLFIFCDCSGKSDWVQ